MTITATFFPQKWQNDYAEAVDPKGDTTWDCTEFFFGQPFAVQNDMLEDSLSGHGSYDLDAMREDPMAPEWIREWDGPFEVSLNDGRED